MLLFNQHPQREISSTFKYIPIPNHADLMPPPSERELICSNYVLEAGKFLDCADQVIKK
jgi:hypothetical protein